MCQRAVDGGHANVYMYACGVCAYVCVLQIAENACMCMRVCVCVCARASVQVRIFECVRVCVTHVHTYTHATAKEEELVDQQIDRI